MPPVVDLVFFDGCPHVEAARGALRRAFAEAGRQDGWSEWRSDDPSLPAYARGFGSPSIFVGGREVTGADPACSGGSCRVYQGQDGALAGAPDPATLAAALAGESA